MKTVICLILSCFMVLMSNSTIFASTLEENTEIESIYKRAYKECQGKSVQKVTNDYEAYTYLLMPIVSSAMEIEGMWKEQKDAFSYDGKPVWKFEKQNGSYAIGWEYIQGEWYCFSEQGLMYRNKWMGDYYLGSDGAMEKDYWIVTKIGSSPDMITYYVGENGKWVEDAVYHGLLGTWKQDEAGWWYQTSDGSYLYNCLEYINDKWYQFDEDGYMMTGLIQNKETGNFHLFNQDGALVIDAGWVEISNDEWVYVWRKYCLVNEKTPDGYFIDETGIWKE